LLPKVLTVLPTQHEINLLRERSEKRETSETDIYVAGVKRGKQHERNKFETEKVPITAAASRHFSGPVGIERILKEVAD
jgi:hypothetical protein